VQIRWILEELSRAGRLNATAEIPNLKSENLVLFGQDRQHHLASLEEAKNAQLGLIIPIYEDRRDR
jgi:hypothetical protein